MSTYVYKVGDTDWSPVSLQDSVTHTDKEVTSRGRHQVTLKTQFGFEESYRTGPGRL